MNIQFLTHEATQAVHLDRVSVLVSLSALRQEWDQAVDGVSLVNIPASVGLLLF
ncbi:MAG: hypothetical protein HY865_24675 [Chloroflexi bacterium]|nr:hypothetical protein [Chloroflexota bacterium]